MRTRDGVIGGLIFAVGAVSGWAVSSAFDDGSTSSDVAAVSDEVGSIGAAVAALADQVGALSGAVESVNDQVDSVGSEVAAVSGEVGALGSEVAALDDGIEPPAPFGIPYVTLACGGEPETRVVESFLVDVDPDLVPQLFVTTADGSDEPTQVGLGDEVPVAAELLWAVRGDDVLRDIADVTDRCGLDEPGPPPFATVTLGCGGEPGSSVVEAFDPDIDPAQTAGLYSRDLSGRLTQLSVGDVVPVDGELQWSILGIARGPWPVDEVIDSCPR